MCEVVERDCAAQSDHEGDTDRKLRKVDLCTIVGDSCCRLVEAFKNAGIEPQIWDITSDLAVPTYQCMLVEKESVWCRPLPQTFNEGSHPVPDIALNRALTEAAQARLTIITGVRDTISRQRYGTYFDLDSRAQDFDEIDTEGQRNFYATVGAEHDDVVDDLNWIVANLRKCGYDQVVAVNLGRPSIGLPVVKVVVPGLKWNHDLYE